VNVTVTQALLGGAILLAAVLAIVGGSPITGWVFAHVERRSGASAGQSVTGIHAAAVVLRGGQTIGFLERTAVFLGLLAGWPEALVGVIALKGLGRFAELRGTSEGAAERFIIGSFTSLLWAAILGGLARLALEHY